MKYLRRKVEAALGGRLIQFASRKMLQSAQLIKKEIQVPTTVVPHTNALTMHYYERNVLQDNNQPTLLLCHGLTDEARNLSQMVLSIKKIQPQWRVLIPDLMGHGHDLERVRQTGVDNFYYPSPRDLVQSVDDFCAALNIDQCFAFGISLGGALVYFLQQQRPTLILKSVLVSPGLETVIDHKFVRDFETGHKNHFCVTSRDDVKVLFRDLSCPQRHAKNPVPKFLLEAIWQDRLAREPTGHFRRYFTRLLQERGRSPDYFGCPKDLAPTLPRLVIWPQDDYIANYDHGKTFFQASPRTTFHSVPNCGHLFMANGTTIVDYAVPLMMDYFQHKQEDIS